MALVPEDDEVGPVAARDRRLELRREAVVRQRQRLDLHVGVRAVPRRHARLERLLLVGAVRVPHDELRGQQQRRREHRSRQRPRVRRGQIDARAAGVEAVQPRRIDRDLHALARARHRLARRRAR